MTVKALAVLQQEARVFIALAHYFIGHKHVGVHHCKMMNRCQVRSELESKSARRFCFFFLHTHEAGFQQNLTASMLEFVIRPRMYLMYLHACNWSLPRSNGASKYQRFVDIYCVVASICSNVKLLIKQQQTMTDRVCSRGFHSASNTALRADVSKAIPGLVDCLYKFAIGGILVWGCAIAALTQAIRGTTKDTSAAALSQDGRQIESIRTLLLDIALSSQAKEVGLTFVK